MKESDLISVIVPVYNAEKYLNRCVDSILSQTMTNFELLLIDDGSQDNSGRICDEYAEKDARVRAFHKPNGGVSSARNLGLDNAMGNWITYVDADDRCSCDYLEHLLSKVDDDTDLIISYAVICDSTGGGKARFILSIELMHLILRDCLWIVICIGIRLRGLSYIGLVLFMRMILDLMR